MQLMKNLTSIFLVLSVAAVVLSGCMTRSVSGTMASYKISISTEVDEPVEDGMTVKTESLGQVHLGKPLLSAEISNMSSIVEDGYPFRDISFESLGPETVLNLSPMLFLQRDAVTGMKEEEILSALNSEALVPESPVFLIVETDEKRVVFKLKTTRLDHPDYVYIQTDLQNAKWDVDAYATTFEIHQISQVVPKRSNTPISALLLTRPGLRSYPLHPCMPGSPSSPFRRRVTAQGYPPGLKLFGKGKIWVFLGKFWNR